MCLLLSTKSQILVFNQSVSVSPKGGLFAVLGDHEDGLVVDPKCGKVNA